MSSLRVVKSAFLSAYDFMTFHSRLVRKSNIIRIAYQRCNSLSPLSRDLLNGGINATAGGVTSVLIGWPGAVSIPMDRLLCSPFTDRLVCDVLTFTEDVSRAGADDVVGISILSSTESLVADQCVKFALCHPLRQCNVMALFA
jgi:hypothetical protein